MSFHDAAESSVNRCSPNKRLHDIINVDQNNNDHKNAEQYGNCSVFYFAIDETSGDAADDTGCCHEEQH